MEPNDDAANAPQAEPNHISTLRRHLLDQVKALRDAGAETVQREIDRSKAVSDLAQAVVNVAKVEVEYLKVTGQQKTGFLEEPPQIESDATGAGLPAPYPANGISSITRHRLRG